MKYETVTKKLLLFFIISISSTIHAQTVREVFVSALSPELLLLSTNNRLDLLDLYENGKDAAVKNVFGDEVSLKRLTDDYLQIQSGNSTTELFLLTMINDSHLIGLIQTVCAPACDSYLEFHFDPEKQLLFQTYRTLSYLNQDGRPIIEKNIRENVKEYKWNGMRFE
jgi:hypothetical protein